jgi:LytS/YehU family sensor histidine kinase
MLAQIGDLLHSSLDCEIKVEVALSDELEFTEKYLAIEQTRLGDRLRFAVLVPAETRDGLVPSMLLQPLVENAVRHGITPRIEGGWIGISSSLHSNRLQIVVSNSGEQRKGEQRQHENGVGLGNTEDRLKTLYGTDYKFLLEWPATGGCQVTVDLPYRTSQYLKEAVHARIDR